jgi:7 transmembrane receptor (rhodopsin family)
MDSDTNYTISTSSVPPRDNSTSESAPQTSNSDEKAFEAAVIAIGVTGTLANGLVLYVLGASKQMKRHAVNILIVNQLSLDLFGSFWLAVIYSVKISGIYIDGSTGYWVCMLITSEDFSWFGIYGSKLNLMIIAMERYFKIVHSIWHKNNAKSWMTYVAVAIPWIEGIAKQTNR